MNKEDYIRIRNEYSPIEVAYFFYRVNFKVGVVKNPLPLEIFRAWVQSLVAEYNFDMIKYLDAHFEINGRIYSKKYIDRFGNSKVDFIKVY